MVQCYNEFVVFAVWVFEIFARVRESIEHSLIQVHEKGFVCWAQLNILIGELFVKIRNIQSVVNARFERRLNLFVGYFVPVDVPEEEVLSNFRLAAALLLLLVVFWSNARNSISISTNTKTRRHPRAKFQGRARVGVKVKEFCK